MRKSIINLVLQADKNNNIDFVPTVNRFIHNELEQPDTTLNSSAECMEYMSSLDNEDFICLYIILINKVKNLTFEEKDSLIKAAQIFSQ